MSPQTLNISRWEENTNSHKTNMITASMLKKEKRGASNNPENREPPEKKSLGRLSREGQEELARACALGIRELM